MRDRHAQSVALHHVTVGTPADDAPNKISGKIVCSLALVVSFHLATFTPTVGGLCS
jgi:hypothetical protein